MTVERVVTVVRPRCPVKAPFRNQITWSKPRDNKSYFEPVAPVV